MSDESSRVTIPKLHDSNYGSWSTSMEALLISKDLFTDIVEVVVDAEDSNGNPRSQEEIDAEIDKKMKGRKLSKMAQARAEMIMRVEPGQLAHMRDKDPLAVWQDLKTVHRARGFAASLAQRRKFLSMKMGKNQSMTRWIGEVKEQAYCMVEAGMAVTDQDQILAITGGLPPSYGPVVTTFDKIPPSDLTLDYVIAHLLSSEFQYGSKAYPATVASPRGSASTSDEALAVHPAQRCYICNDVGHLRRNCPYRDAVKKLKEQKEGEQAQAAIGLDSEDEYEFEEGENVVE